MSIRDKFVKTAESEAERIISILANEDPASESYEQCLKNFEKLANMEEEMSNPKSRRAKLLENQALVGGAFAVAQIAMILVTEQVGHSVITSLATRFVRNR